MRSSVTGFPISSVAIARVTPHCASRGIEMELIKWLSRIMINSCLRKKRWVYSHNLNPRVVLLIILGVRGYYYRVDLQSLIEKTRSETNTRNCRNPLIQNF